MHSRIEQGSGEGVFGWMANSVSIYIELASSYFVAHKPFSQATLMQEGILARLVGNTQIRHLTSYANQI
jgi:hypothetical protein